MPDEFIGKGLPIDDDALQDALDLAGIGAAELWAVVTVETTGCGFLQDRRPKILFERHVFSRQTAHRYDISHPNLSNDRPGGYGEGGAHQYDRLEQAIALDRPKALMSTSWGIGQVMGFNAPIVGYRDVEEMIVAMRVSEGNQLTAMARFLTAKQLERPLRAHDWPRFARGYNGPDYATNSYDTRLAAAYGRFLHGGLPDIKIRSAQVFLLYLGYDPGPIDGVMGRLTRSALNEFQEEKRLDLTYTVDEATFSALQASAVLAV
jgi:N-acetylmuramidase/Putative peptidoglycan binding domain